MLLISTIKKCEAYSPSLLSFPPAHLPSHPPRSSQSTELSSLCYMVAFHQPSILHTVVYVSMPLSQNAPASPSLSFPFCVHKSFLYICISISALSRCHSIVYKLYPYTPPQELSYGRRCANNNSDYLPGPIPKGQILIACSLTYM